MVYHETRQRRRRCNNQQNGVQKFNGISFLRPYALSYHKRRPDNIKVSKVSKVSAIVRPKAAKPARAHGLPKIHKKFDKMLKFRPIVDTTGTTRYGVGKFLSQLQQSLTKNEHTVKDTFDAKTRVETIDKALFTQRYQYISFDVESLFTNVPLERTLAIVERRIYDENELATTLKKTTLRKLIRDIYFQENNL